MTDQNSEDFASLLAEYEQKDSGSRNRETPSVGDTVHGKVVSISNDSIFVTLGAKAEAVLARDQVTNADGELTVALGDTVEAHVVDIQDGQVILRTSLGRGPDAYAELQQAFEHGIPIDGLVTNVVKSGVEVQVAGKRGFCPISQLDNRFIEDPSEFVGQRLQFRVIRFESGRGPNINIVLSRRALLDEAAAVQAVETREKLKVGAVLPGRITSVKPYGAFVDLGGIEGMLHISELGFARVEHPNEVVSVGQQVEVQVIKIEKTDNPKRPEKIGLSLKALAADPWDAAAAQFQEGVRISGTVVRTEPFGAFVELVPGVEGLIHVSQMGIERRINHARDVVKIGDTVDVAVIAVDRDRRRISLSMSAARQQDEDREVSEYLRGSQNGDYQDDDYKGESDGGKSQKRNYRRERRESAKHEGGGAGFGTLGDLLKYKKR